jgi:hypothetical protein
MLALTQHLLLLLKDLFIQINLNQYLKRQGIDLDIKALQGLVNQ